MRVASLVIGDAIRRGGLALDGPVGAAILAHRPDAAGLVFQQGQMGAQGFGRRAGQRRALTGAPALMPELLVLALAAAGRVPDDGCFAAATRSGTGWCSVSCRPHSIDRVACGTLRRKEVCDLV